MRGVHHRNRRHDHHDHDHDDHDQHHHSMNSIDTVNAAATAIAAAEARAPPAAAQKRRWGSCWSLYWCFGHQKSNKRIGHAVLLPEPVALGNTAPAAENQATSTAIVLPFIAPPSSPASFLQSDPPSVTQSPAGLLSLTSLSINAYSPRGPASIFAIGPYAYETQLVSPPVFSTFTTEPSTAPFTPPPESVQLTTPSSPEVPFAQLLTSSLERTQRGGGTNHKFSLSNCEFLPNQSYPGSPGGNLRSPGSAVSYSGTTSPFPGKRPFVELRMGEAPKLWGFENFSTRKWGSRVGSGSITPDGAGLLSRLGSGSLTPDGMGVGSRLGSGCLTPDGTGPMSHDGFLPFGNQLSIRASVPRLDDGSKHDETIVDHRVSFELTGEDVARCLANKAASSFGTLSECPEDEATEVPAERGGTMGVDDDSDERFTEKGTDDKLVKGSGPMEKDHSYQKHRSVTLGSTKEFNFDNRNGGISSKPNINSEWWANDKVAGKDMKSGSSWSFFPMLQPEVS
ncbi:hypothetical protein NL676_000272 [Syzygium grande]|nr:hypothetical protein NL676_000272 [Syzygium grande]